MPRRQVKVKGQNLTGRFALNPSPPKEVPHPSAGVSMTSDGELNFVLDRMTNSSLNVELEQSFTRDFIIARVIDMVVDEGFYSAINDLCNTVDVAMREKDHSGYNVYLRDPVSGMPFYVTYINREINALETYPVVSVPHRQPIAPTTRETLCLTLASKYTVDSPRWAGNNP